MTRISVTGMDLREGQDGMALKQIQGNMMIGEERRDQERPSQRHITEKTARTMERTSDRSVIEILHPVVIEGQMKIGRINHADKMIRMKLM